MQIIMCHRSTVRGAGPSWSPPPPEADAMNEPFAPERDQLMVPRLTGAARRHAPGREPATAETAAAVRDLLAEVAGLLIGYYRRAAEEVRARGAAYYCMAAAADLTLIQRWVEVAASPRSRARWWGDPECVRPNTVRSALNSLRVYYVSESAGRLSAQMSGDRL